MAKRSTNARGIKPAGVFISSYRWVYPCRPDALWKALTRDINKWWPREFFAQQGSRAFRLDARVGGLMYEDGPPGAGLVWGQVWAVQPGVSLVVVGHTTPQFGGPCTGTMEYTIAPDKGGAALSLRHGQFGAASVAARRSLDDGWNALFDGALRAYLGPGGVVSSRPKPKVSPHRA